MNFNKEKISKDRLERAEYSPELGEGFDDYKKDLGFNEEELKDKLVLDIGSGGENFSTEAGEKKLT